MLEKWKPHISLKHNEYCLNPLRYYKFTKIYLLYHYKSKTTMSRILLLCFFISQSLLVYSQNFKPQLDQISRATQPHHLEDLKIKPLPISVPPGDANGNFQNSLHRFTALKWKKPTPQLGSLKAITDEASGLPIYIEGKIGGVKDEKGWEGQSFAYLAAIKEFLKLQNPANEFMITKIETDNLGQTHIHLQQIYKNIKVYGGEVILHGKDGEIELFTGRYYPTPLLTDVQPKITAEVATGRALQNLSKTVTIKPLSSELQLMTGIQPAVAELSIYHVEHQADAERLAWVITLHPNFTQRWLYVIDAKTGAMLHQINQTCTIDGGLHSHQPSDFRLPTSDFLLPPRTANAADLYNTTRIINTWQQGSTYYLIDAARPMFNATESVFPDNPVGVIRTLDIKNQIISGRFSAEPITSTNNIWNNRTAVSAHYNAGKAYEYYLNTFQRNSIDGRGGNILSFINVVDEDSTSLDNAFWNGIGIFYGNGKTEFTAPLAKALDVAGHEMSHGVIESTANLEYDSESGAINESFADIFGAMIDREDWLIGEDISNRTIFPSGALRDMSNPNNGRTTLGQPGWQPASVSQQYRGTQDNGGVHINSGIPNRAYYLFATAVGKDKAERVYYRALTQYLTRSSQFIDLRLAVLRAAADLYGNTEVTAATTAFNTVGIVGNTPSQKPTDLAQNPGTELILFSDKAQSDIIIRTPTGSLIADQLATSDVLSKPSVTDNGETIVYVDGDKNIKALLIDWQQGTVDEQTLSASPIWRNVVISKDGTKVAALTDDFDNLLYVFNLATGGSQVYELFNPTYTEGITTGDVAYADALEWDYTGESVMYDALSNIRTLTDTIEQWDIGFIRVWNNAAKTFGDGMIAKLFSGLPENVSVGNPTFSKKSSYIIALDYADFDAEEYYILGTNTETGDVGTIYQNDDISFPNYSIPDNRLLFNAMSTAGNAVLGVVTLATDKINASTDPPVATILISNGTIGAQNGVWFANGSRQLTDNKELNLFDQSLEIFPNPFEEIIYLRGVTKQQATVGIEVFNALGTLVATKVSKVESGIWQESMLLRNLPAGSYVLRLTAGSQRVSRKMIKLK